ncbi:putative oligosaccharyltransferase complex subunit CG9662 [Selaginella moellendorffii]|nr:putative oligosaccharyltransferase complex subunit CG9662 [Selaginella moellendorffii]XP_002991440.2 putative oligosaccharyltransferase complex subunit CG9662 [Selaginella moellendorffii]|eukprot:XP_002988335.2 putative oligosaccharyltransferase complex subunit CG9662 [Selaginella moellendorffii]
MDPVEHAVRLIYKGLRPPRMRLRSLVPELPSPMTAFFLVLASYFLVVSGIIYDVIVEPPGIGSRQDPVTGAIRPVVFLPGRVNGQYIIEGLSSGFMFVLGGMGIVALDLATHKGWSKNVRMSFGLGGIAAVVIAYAMSVLFIRIKIPAYLH